MARTGSDEIRVGSNLVEQSVTSALALYCVNVTSWVSASPQDGQKKVRISGSTPSLGIERTNIIS